MVAVVAIFSFFFRATPFFLWGKKSPSCVLETNFCRHNRERERERERVRGVVGFDAWSLYRRR